MIPWRSPLATAVFATLVGAWVGVFLIGEQPAAFLAVPLSVAGMALLGRLPIAAAWLVLAAAVVCAVAGVAYGTVEMLLPTVVVMYRLGRSRTSAVYGAVFTVGFALASALRVELLAANLFATLAIYGAGWVFGRIVRRRGRKAEYAVRYAVRLAALDPSRVAEAAAARERRRVASRSLQTVRDAVVDMRALARLARLSLDRRMLEEIRERGAEATQQLHDILGLLRDPEPAPAAREEPSERAFPLLRETLATLLGMLVLLGGVVLLGGEPFASALGALCLLLPVSLALARRVPLAGALVAATATAAVALDPPPAPEELLPTGVAFAALAWTLAPERRLGARVGLAALVLGSVALAWGYGVEAVGYIVVVIAVSAFAGFAWGEKDRILDSERARSARLQAHLALIRARTERAERLRIARELHDVASHALGVMTLQAQAAAALAGADAERARRALALVDSVGEAALAEIAALSDWFEPGAPREDAGGAARRRRLRDELDRLIGQMTELGLTVDAELLALGELPDDERLDRVVYRVVQESLANAVRYAPGSSVRIIAQARGDGFELRVVDDGSRSPADPARASSGCGLGLTGLAERVRAHDGEFSAGRLPKRGFEVRARLPLVAALEREPEPSAEAIR